MTPRYVLEDRIVLTTGAACGVGADVTKSDDFAAMGSGQPGQAPGRHGGSVMP